MRWAVAVVVLLGACFSPQPTRGAPCNELDECPAGFSCMFGVCSDNDAHGARIGFTTETSLEDELSGTITLSVVLSHPALVPITVGYAVVGGTATSGVDFTSSDGSLEFAVGETEKSFELTIVLDALEETDETIELALSGATGGVVSIGAHTITISANVLARAGFATPTASALESVPTTLDVILDIASALPITVDYTIAGTATDGGVDHTLASGTLMFDVGVTSQPLPLGVVNDLLDEDDETVIVTLANPVNGKLGTNPALTYSILDDDATPTVAFTTASSSVSETTATVSLTVSLSAVSGRPVTVPFAAGIGTAVSPADYSYGTSSPLSFPPGTASLGITVNIVNDSAAEVDETVVTTLGTPTNATLGGLPTRMLTILDDDRSCYGTGNFAVCLATPSGAVTLPSSINTDASGLCQVNQPLSWMSQGQPASCVIAGATIAVSAQTVVSGSRPLVLVAADAITVSATLDVASHRGGTVGPGSPSLSCSAFPVTPGNNNGGAGGGAAGSFMSRGGNGGTGDNGGGAAGVSPAANTAAPAVLRAGCDGQLAGKSGNDNPGPIGRGGGAVYLVAGNSITITGAINASGSAGSAGAPVAGGSGAGSGGMIKLYAPAITATGAIVIANGGGGASGGGSSASGVAGADPSTAAPVTPAAGGISATAGDGGNGWAGVEPATSGTTGGAGTGGGGGGGGGGYLQSNVPLTGAITSAGLIQ